MHETRPVLITHPSEAMAHNLMNLLVHKKAPFDLSKPHQQIVSALIQAIRQGQKTRVYHYSQPFYETLFRDEDIIEAYFQIKHLNIQGNSNFSIIMDWFKAHYGNTLPKQGHERPLEEALICLILTITHRPQNSISYRRQDAKTGQMRPTTFPLSEEMIRDFIEPFQNQTHLLEQAVIFHQQVVLGNPAGTVQHRYQEKCRRIQQDQQTWDQLQKKNLHNNLPTEPSKSNKPDTATNLQVRIEELYQHCQSTAEIRATQYLFRPENMAFLDSSAQPSSFRFTQQIEQIYAEKLTPEQAQKLARRMARALQNLLRELADQSGPDWMALWSKAQTQTESKKSAQNINNPKEIQTQIISDMLARARVQLDKLKGQKILSEQTSESMTDFQSEMSPSQRAVFSELAEEQIFQQLRDISVARFDWEQLSATLQNALVALFQYFPDGSMSFITMVRTKS